MNEARLIDVDSLKGELEHLLEHAENGDHIVERLKKILRLLDERDFDA